ncbi:MULTISPECIES: hypothetical protein [unclassified Streptomyces]|uniref:hypothetical protein n=1 Tax=unclassified Streptomyces TaxID=2593676 RepID=UPI000805108B|nr:MULTISPECIES: hypothetical protein [unclassified Streptomyces]SBU97477.1 hypothetical protein YW5DRAFT_05530 [Streptomyces sp. Ncost-T6T-1]
MRRILPVAVTATATTALLLSGIAPAVADELPPVAVEDFVYPDADRIYAERGIRLTTGDGNMLLADCGSATGLIEVWARDVYHPFCFSVKGATGRLAMELPAVYGIKGNAYKIVADMTVDGTETSFDITPNTWTAVGQTADPEKRDHTLVELRATK